ncbi:MAG: glycosyltransferase, partial [[Pasteurella] aerogenes]|nr:glycosyltransferase [[Pasteurella] aerogenes]
MNISFVIPVFNEEETIPLFYKEISSSKALSEYSLELIFINDGSTDNTLLEIQELQKTILVDNPQSAIRNPQSAIRNPQSAIRNPQSAIRNPQSAIRNP